ncbi:hypothetical protein CA13_26750 [Planctomycetes bacterium CA13]|uniref:Uncharacterized protein n=1 Tax=Novipirellula herctigrandis TaxID=2527986 RepID=A0A5C5Z1Z9_9BACT|nr:hypothetical protein CA13_26750 [Planctomycetes bacterium CA13]
MSSGVQTETNPSESLQDRRVERQQEREKLRTSRFDVVTSLFMALILFIGTFVLMLFLIWLFTRFEFPPKPIAAIIENAAGRGENAEGTERDFEPPGAEEVQELMEPTLEETIEAVTDAVSTVPIDANFAPNQGSSKGDSRPPGPMGEGADIVPRGERWQLKFSAKNLEGYSAQLDFYKIELGAIGGSIQGVDVASNVSGSPKKRRIVDTENEKRLYFMWTSVGPLMQYDRQLLQKASIPLPGRQMLKFIPQNLENQLANIELEYSRSKGHPSVTEIAKTIFESKSQGSGYVFEVVDQRYRKARR